MGNFVSKSSNESNIPPLVDNEYTIHTLVNAAYQADYTLFERCLDSGVSVKKSAYVEQLGVNCTPLHAICASPHANMEIQYDHHAGEYIVQRLINCKASVSEHTSKSENNVTVAINSIIDYNPLHLAVRYNNLRLIPYLVKNKADVNKRSGDTKTSLCIAAENNNEEAVRMLLELKANPSLSQTSSHLTPLYIACSKLNYSNTEQLLLAGADVNGHVKYNMTPLYIATMRGNESLVDLLLRHRADVNKSGFFQQSCLSIASACGHATIVDTLLEANSDVNSVNHEGKSALFFAATQGEAAICRTLIRLKADVNKADTYGCSPLFKACLYGFSTIVDLLINTKADVNAVRSDESNPHETPTEATPLLTAVVNDHTDAIILLVQAGADVNFQVVRTTSTIQKPRSSRSLTQTTTSVITTSPPSSPQTSPHCSPRSSLSNATNICIKYNDNAFLAALRRCDSLAVIRLMMNHANMLAIGFNDSTVIHAAAMNANHEILRAVIEARSRTNE